MNKNFSVIICTLALLLSITSCNSRNIVNDLPEENVNPIENLYVVEEAKHYEILKKGFDYYYYIYDDNRAIVYMSGFDFKMPKVTMVNDDIIKFRTQVGTGIGTSTTFYYNSKRDVLSRWFNSVYDETDEVVVFSYYKKLIVRDIFDKTIYYREFTEFNNISDITEPFITVEFTNDGKSMEVTYFTGEDYQEFTEIVDLTY